MEVRSMVKLIAFETEEELIELAGLTYEELWNVGFNLDDQNIVFQSNTKLHRKPAEEEIQERDYYDKDELIADYDLPCHWLMMQMNNYCVRANYVFYNGMHYYIIHHS